MKSISAHEIAAAGRALLQRGNRKPKANYCPECKSHGWMPVIDRSGGRNIYLTKPCPRCSTPKA